MSDEFDDTEEEMTPDEVLRVARDRYDESDGGARDNRDWCSEDIRFARLGDQWPEAIRKQRLAESRPILTVNRLPSFIRQVVNDARLNKPGILVKPVDNGADVATADVLTGLIRSIERNSQAETAYDTAIDNSVSGGFGFFRIGIQHVNPRSFAMQCIIDRIPNPLAVHWDVSSTRFDAEDWRYAFVEETVERDEFEERWPGKAATDFMGDTSDTATGNDTGAHNQADEVRLVEYWEKVEDEERLFEIETLTQAGTQTVRLTETQIRANAGDAIEMLEAFSADIVSPDVMTEDEEEVAEDFDPITEFVELTGGRVVRMRNTEKITVTRRLLSGSDVLEEELWPGTMIPICPVWGEEVFHEGRRYFRSMIRDARDPQTMFNFWRTAATELVALAPRAPYLVEEGGIPAGQEEAWRTANTRSHSYLMYSRGTNIPQRQSFAGVPAGAVQEALNAADDMKSVTGVFDAALGARGNETSGVAISARQRESDVGNFHFIDNLNRALEYAGRVLVELIPHVYTEQETVRILGPDSVEKVVAMKASGLAAAQSDAESRASGPADQAQLYDFSVGEYDVSIEAGPSFATQREETRDTLIEIMRQVPGAAPVIGDKVVEHLDFQGATEIAERLRLLFQATNGFPLPGTQDAQPGNQGPQGPVGPGGPLGAPGGAPFPVDGGNLG